MHRFIRHRLGALAEAVGYALVLAIFGGTAITTLPGLLDLGGVRAGTGSIGGTAFMDLDRDGIRDPDEDALAGDKILLMDSSGITIRNALTDAAGGFSFADLAQGHYTVRYSPQDWWELREAWVPTTTGSIRPDVPVDLTSSAVADFGWRPIERSVDIASPMSRYVGPNGLTVESFNDVVAAQDVYEAVMAGVVGREAASVVVRLGWSASSSTSTATSRADGLYATFSAVSYVTLSSWLDGDWTLSHEYGHAWSLYYAHMVQQDPTLSGYLMARQLAGDARVGTSYAWQPRELIADDYRQLFGSATAQAVAPLNLSIPSAADVPGLRAYLERTFIGEAAPALPSPTPTPLAAPTSSPAPTAIPTPQATASPAPTPGPASSVTPAPSSSPADLALTGLTVSPTPIKAQAAIGFDISGSATVSLSVVNSRGVVVRVLLDQAPVPAGHVSVNWDRRDAAGRRVKSGAYVVRVSAQSATDADQVQAPITVS